MKKIIAYIKLNDECLKDKVQLFISKGVDEICFFGVIKDELERRNYLEFLQAQADIINIPFGVCMGDSSLEDVKYTLYTGVSFLYLDSKLDKDIFEKSKKRFGEEKIRAYNSEDSISLNEDEIFIEDIDKSVDELKQGLVAKGFDVMVTESAICFAEFKLDANGLLPVVVQDYKTGKVLMMAYMNEEAFNLTVSTGRMTYFSRSRQKLWLKGETSGHFQFVKNLYIDCDKDTLLAKVKQVGVACHTGNESCFYTNILSNEKEKQNALTVFENLYNVIADRKINPKEGSYTNYLFDKGLDKILKKVGEECTETVIAAKNEAGYEVKYEIADLLYHLSVLMVEQKVTWEDIVVELLHR